ncbi:MAG: TetR/AcrR family transcriptional regulator [Polyangiales bacterium]
MTPSRAPESRPGAPGGARDTRRRTRTAHLAEVALARFLDAGVEGVSIDDIASAAGVAKGSFYTYFDDKPALVHALLRTVADPVREALTRCEGEVDAATTPAALRGAYLTLAGALAAAILAEPRVVALYLQESRGASVGARAPLVALSEEVHARAVDLTRAAHRHGLLKPLDPVVTATAVVGAAEALIHRALTSPDGLDAGAVTEALVTMVVDGIAAKPQEADDIRGTS